MMLSAVNLVQQRRRTEGVRHDAESVRIRSVTGGANDVAKKEINSEKYIKKKEEERIRREIPTLTR